MFPGLLTPSKGAAGPLRATSLGSSPPTFACQSGPGPVSKEVLTSPVPHWVLEPQRSSPDPRPRPGPRGRRSSDASAWGPRLPAAHHLPVATRGLVRGVDESRRASGPVHPRVRARGSDDVPERWSGPACGKRGPGRWSFSAERARVSSAEAH